jgi:hydroxymethylglutaryl-CoA lyase
VMRTPPDEVALADTIGVAGPHQVIDLIARVRSAAATVPLRCHFHDTRNTGVANAFAASQAGVEWLDASLGGIGGCPFSPAATGNVATEDLTYMFGRGGIDTGLSLTRLLAAATRLAAALGRPPTSALTRAGDFPVLPSPPDASSAAPARGK